MLRWHLTCLLLQVLPHCRPAAGASCCRRADTARLRQAVQDSASAAGQPLHAAGQHWQASKQQRRRSKPARSHSSSRTPAIVSTRRAAVGSHGQVQSGERLCRAHVLLVRVRQQLPPRTFRHLVCLSCGAAVLHPRTHAPCAAAAAVTHARSHAHTATTAQAARSAQRLDDAAGPGPSSGALAAAAAAAAATAAAGPGRVLLPQLLWGQVAPLEALLQPGWVWLLAAGAFGWAS
jgi:hypothetical protein